MKTLIVWLCLLCSVAGLSAATGYTIPNLPLTNSSVTATSRVEIAAPSNSVWKSWGITLQNIVDVGMGSSANVVALKNFLAMGITNVAMVFGPTAGLGTNNGTLYITNLFSSTSSVSFDTVNINLLIVRSNRLEFATGDKGIDGTVAGEYIQTNRLAGNITLYHTNYSTTGTNLHGAHIVIPGAAAGGATYWVTNQVQAGDLVYTNFNGAFATNVAIPVEAGTTLVLDSSLQKFNGTNIVFLSQANSQLASGSTGSVSGTWSYTNIYGGIYTTLFGEDAGVLATNVEEGVFVGYHAGRFATNAGQSVLIGDLAGQDLTSDTANGSQAVTAIGWRAATSAANMSSMVALGYQAADSAIGGQSAVVAGTHTAQGAVNFAYSVLLGYYIAPSAVNWNNCIIIGGKGEALDGAYSLWIDGYRGINLEPSVPLISGNFLTRYLRLRGNQIIDNTLESSNQTALTILGNTASAPLIAVTNGGAQKFVVSSSGDVTAAGSYTASAVGTNIFGATTLTNGLNSTLSNALPAVVVSVSGSPYLFTNTTGHILLANISGGAVQGLARNGAFWCAAFTNSANLVPLKAGEWLSVTNTTAPALVWIAL